LLGFASRQQRLGAATPALGLIPLVLATGPLLETFVGATLFERAGVAGTTSGSRGGSASSAGLGTVDAVTRWAGTRAAFTVAIGWAIGTRTTRATVSGPCVGAAVGTAVAAGRATVVTGVATIVAAGTTITATITTIASGTIATTATIASLSRRRALFTSTTLGIAPLLLAGGLGPLLVFDFLHLLGSDDASGQQLRFEVQHVVTVAGDAAGSTPERKRPGRRPYGVARAGPLTCQGPVEAR
jgi:hypothetical protein